MFKKCAIKPLKTMNGNTNETGSDPLVTRKEYRQEVEDLAAEIIEEVEEPKKYEDMPKKWVDYNEALFWKTKKHDYIQEKRFNRYVIKHAKNADDDIQRVTHQKYDRGEIDKEEFNKNLARAFLYGDVKQELIDRGAQ